MVPGNEPLLKLCQLVSSQLTQTESHHPLCITCTLSAYVIGMLLFYLNSLRLALLRVHVFVGQTRQSKSIGCAGCFLGAEFIAALRCGCDLKLALGLCRRWCRFYFLHLILWSLAKLRSYSSALFPTIARGQRCRPLDAM
jgi:hypothetical protein